MSPFYGITYVLNDNLIFKLEKDATSNNGNIEYEIPKSDFSYSINFFLNNNFSLGIANERGNYLSFKFSYKNNPVKSYKKYKYKKSKNINNDDTKYQKLIKNIESNNIGVNKVLKNNNSIGVELTQYTHTNIGVIEEIIESAAIDSGLDKNIKKELRTANLIAIKEYSSTFENEAQIIYERKKQSNFNSNTTLKFKPFLASRESFLKGALL